MTLISILYFSKMIDRAGVWQNIVNVKVTPKYFQIDKTLNIFCVDNHEPSHGRHIAQPGNTKHSQPASRP